MSTHRTPLLLVWAWVRSDRWMRVETGEPRPAFLWVGLAGSGGYNSRPPGKGHQTLAHQKECEATGE